MFGVRRPWQAMVDSSETGFGDGLPSLAEICVSLFASVVSTQIESVDDRAMCCRVGCVSRRRSFAGLALHSRLLHSQAIGLYAAHTKVVRKSGGRLQVCGAHLGMRFMPEGQCLVLGNDIENKYTIVLDCHGVAKTVFDKAPRCSLVFVQNTTWANQRLSALLSEPRHRSKCSASGFHL